jgi:hypothetical protein
VNTQPLQHVAVDSPARVFLGDYRVLHDNFPPLTWNARGLRLAAGPLHNPKTLIFYLERKGFETCCGACPLPRTQPNEWGQTRS